jgi:hypothetical protein
MNEIYFKYRNIRWIGEDANQLQKRLGVPANLFFSIHVGLARTPKLQMSKVKRPRQPFFIRK